MQHLSSATVIIPARFESTRFPGKVLADRTGKPLIEHVYERASQARLVSDVIVATDDERIIDAVEKFGGKAVLTRSDHPNGTSRIAEIAVDIAADLIVNVQGDEPEIQPGHIDLAISTLDSHESSVMATIASPFTDDEDPANPNIVKIVVGRDGAALYFSRSLIPYDRDGKNKVKPLKHIGLYVYRKDFLPKYVSLPMTDLEQTEKLEQLRVLEYGYKIAVAIANVKYHGIDTPQQYNDFVNRYFKAQQTTTTS